MTWAELTLIVPRGELPATSALLHQLGAAGLQEDFLPGETPPYRQPWDTGPDAPLPPRALLRAWFEDPQQAPIDAALQRAGRGEPTWSAVAETDWEQAWRAGFEVLTVGEVIIAPPWEEVPAHAVIIEPGQGFGTGRHPTTRGALEGLVAIAPQVQTVLDVGSGSGVLALAAARLGKRAWGIDNDEDAVRDAIANAARNDLDVRFTGDPIASLTEPADLVLANLFAEALLSMRDDLLRLTGRWLVLAGILADREHLVRGAFDRALKLEERRLDGEWVCLWYRAE
ncbi:MAG: 50S ribosomal protein L11 methyltransferase [Deltaproteobacteria bacterium]|nr:50S ribosomal protein L11 methyltransferase [Deltaproteobacteria bacterium]